MKFSIEFITEKFDLCVQQGLARPFDTKTTATSLMYSVLQGIEVRVQQHPGREAPYDPTEMFRLLQNYILELGRLPG